MAAADYKCTYVYMRDGEKEIANVTVSMAVDKRQGKMQVVVEDTEGYYPIKELKSILSQFEKTCLSKAKIDLIDECEVYVKVAKTFKKIILDKNYSVVKEEAMMM